MKVTVDGQDYVVRFKHYQATAKRGRWCTTCQVLVIIGAEARPIAAEGAALCGLRDNFCRETGRKLALARALLSAADVFSREARRAFWTAYLTRPRGSTQVPTKGAA